MSQGNDAKSKLSPKELAVFEMLMATVKKKERQVNLKKKGVAGTQPEYICRFEIKCKTCNLVYFESYYMEPDTEAGGSIGMMIPEDKITDCCNIKTQEREVLTCNSCVERLMQLDKEEIIIRYLKEKRRWR